MNSIRISRARFSEVVWGNIIDHAETESDIRTLLADRASAYVNLRDRADYNTGSITVGGMYTLFCVAHFFKPKIVAEVGTFIGNSTFALVEGAGDNCAIHTCDYSNDIKLESGINAIQYPKTSSTAMLKAMRDANLSVDMVFLDGRLQPDDVPLLEQLTHGSTVFLLDDFEGIEKGVANAGMLLSSKQYNKLYYHLVYPSKYSNIAMLLPRKCVEWTDQ